MRRLFPRVYYGWVMVAASLVINMSVSPLNTVVFSFLIGPISADLGVQKSALAWALTLRLVAAGLSGPAIGVLIDRHGSRWLGALSGAWTILAHNAIWGISAGGWITLNSLVWPNYFGRLHLGAIRGIVLPVSIAASSAGAPLFGYLLDSGMAPAHLWTLGLCGFLLSAIFVLLARPPRAPGEPPTIPGRVSERSGSVA